MKRIAFSIFVFEGTQYESYSYVHEYSSKYSSKYSLSILLLLELNQRDEVL